MTDSGGRRRKGGRQQRPVVRKRHRLRGCLVLFVLAAAVAALFALAHPLWLPVFGRTLVVADPLQRADAVVALAGDEQRAAFAARLFNAGYADWYVATDARVRVPGVRESYAELVRREAVWEGVPEAQVLVAPGLAESTYEEALAVRQLAQEQGWRVLLVVTDPYHTRRARLAFRDVFRGSGVSVVVRPVDNHWYDPDSWWLDREGMRETGSEYLKLALYLLGCR